MYTDLFIEIFTGLKRNHGQAHMDQVIIDPKTGKKRPKYDWAHKEVTKEDYIAHLNGKQALGIQPCDDEGMCSFAAIDIDDKQHSYTNFPYQTYLDLISKYDLPVVPVKSKSGGLHLYVFTKEPVKAIFLRNFLEKLLLSLSLPSNIEIYPMQTELGQDPDGEWINGKFINLPYFGKKERVSITFEGKERTFEEFMEVVKINRYSKEELENFANQHVKKMLMGGSAEFEDGPPCLQILTKDKLKDGRDRFLYNYMVFAKKKYPDEWETKILEAAREYIVYDKVWGDAKVQQKIKAWKKETKGYTCEEDPIFGVCQKPVCRERTFGILSDKKKNWPPFSNLTKINYQPDPQYTFDVTLRDGKVKEVKVPNQNIFYNKALLKGCVTKYADIHLPDIRPFQYDDHINKLFPPKNIYDPPKSATLEGQFENQLKEHINGTKAKTFASFKTGSILIEDNVAFFKIDSFHKRLKNQEIKFTLQETIKFMMDHYGAEEMGKRFPKKDTDKKSNPPITVIQIPISKKLEKENETIELVQMKKREEIF
jgi:hypothetical protein